MVDANVAAPALVAGDVAVAVGPLRVGRRDGLEVLPVGEQKFFAPAGLKGVVGGRLEPRSEEVDGGGLFADHGLRPEHVLEQILERAISRKLPREILRDAGVEEMIVEWSELVDKNTEKNSSCRSPRRSIVNKGEGEQPQQ